MLETIDNALPTVVLVVALLAVVALMVRFYARLPEILEDPTGKLSSKRTAAMAVTAWAMAGWSFGIDISFEMWGFIAFLWGMKTWQRRIENGTTSYEYEYYDEEPNV